MEASDAPIPDVEIQSFDKAPPEVAQWLGHFKGAWYSRGEVALCQRLIIYRIDAKENGEDYAVRTKYSHGVYPAWRIAEPNVYDWHGKLNDRGELTLKWKTETGWSRIATYRIQDANSLSGTFAWGKGDEPHNGWSIVNTAPTNLMRQD